MSRDLIPTGPIGGLSSRDKALDAYDEREKQLIREKFGDDLALLSFSAGIERENYTSRYINQRIRGVEFETHKLDPNYRWQDDEASIGYNPGTMSYARNAAEAEEIRANIDSERASLGLIAASNWGAAGQVFGSIFQPHVAAGIAVAPYSLAGMVAAETGMEAGSEVLLHNMQYTRTMEESFWNVGLTAMGVSLLGGAAKLAQKSVPNPPADVIDDINNGFAPGSGEAVIDSVGARRVVDEEAITAEEDALIGGRLADFFSIGQMSNLVNSVSDTARDIASKMADNPLFTRAHAKGKTRGVSVEALHEAAMGRVVIATDKAAAMQKSSGLEPKEFDKQVGVAMSNGDRHNIPKVQEAAEMYRADVVGPIQEAAERLGLLENADGLRFKVKILEDDIARLRDEGAGPGSVAAKAAVETERAKIIAAAAKGETQLQKRVDTLKAKLDVARTTGKDGTKRTAPPSMIKQHNEARSALTAHRKATAKATVAQDKKLTEMKAQKAQIAAARAELRTAKARVAQGGTAFAESYFPRVYDRNAIYENWATLQRMLENKFKADPAMSKMKPEQITEQAIDTIQNMIGGRGQRVSGGGTPTALRARVLSLMDNELEPFLVKGASQTMIHHAQNLQPYIMMREAFGDRSFADMISQVKDDYKKLLTADPAQAQKLDKEMAKDIDRLTIMHDRLMHQIQRAVRPRNPMEKVLQYSKLWNLATMLGGIVVSSLPDIARPISHYGLRSFGKGVAKTMSQFASGISDMSTIQVKRTGAALQRTLNDRAMQLTDSLEGESKLLQGGQKIWSRFSGFDVYTDIMESVASHAAMDYVVRNAAKVASKQPLRKADIKQLTRMGLDEDALRNLYRETQATMGSQDSVLKYMNTMEWKDVQLAQRVEAAVGSDVRRTIIRIGAGEKPAFMDETTYSWLFQFMSFAMSAQNKIMVAGLQNMNRHTAEGLVAMMALGAGVGAIKGTLRGQDVSKWSAEQWVFEGIDRSGMVGALREPMNTLRYVGAMTGVTDGIPSRYAGQGWERALTPPAAAVAGNIGRSITAAIGGDRQKALEHAMKATPMINNTWHIREVLQKLGDS